MKRLFIAEKPSVAAEFAKALKCSTRSMDGYLEGEDVIVTWCVGHLVTMSYPEKYSPDMKRWSKDTLPFIPKEFKYEVIGNVKKQYNTVASLLNREDVGTIYVCTDSGREGEYIYRLVDMMAKVPDTKDKRRVWIDSQTEDEIRRGIKEAKPIAEYDNLSSSAYLRAKEDYLMGINFSRILSVVYGQTLNESINAKKWSAISVGRVMTCVLGMIVRREREIRDFVKTPFYRVIGEFEKPAGKVESDQPDLFGLGVAAGGDSSVDDSEGTVRKFAAEWKAVKGSRYFETPYLYKENGFKEMSFARKLCDEIAPVRDAVIKSIEKKKEKKNPPLLFNLAELQNICSKVFKISPDQTLQIAQELYEKKLVTYPRTDARVLSTAIAGEIYKNISGLKGYSVVAAYAEDVMNNKRYSGIEKTKYVNDKLITDHYAIIPTGQGLGALSSLSQLAARVYEVIARRFLAIFFPPAEYERISVVASVRADDIVDEKTSVTEMKDVTSGENDPNAEEYEESFFTSRKILKNPGFLSVMQFSFVGKDKDESGNESDREGEESGEGAETEEDLDITLTDEEFAALFDSLRKGSRIKLTALNIKEGETSPPKRYNSGQMILAMENAGQLIEDEELRAQIKGSGIGTSATRAEILKKLVNIGYINLNKKTQIYTPAYIGEAVYEIVYASIRSMLNPELTASWELGLSQVAEGEISEELYMQKLDAFIRRNVNYVKENNYNAAIRIIITGLKKYYKKY